MTIPPIESPEVAYQALSSLIVECSELVELEKKLGDFNLFQVLKSERSELKHSNVLAWLLDPFQAHGLDSLFLQKWLMRVTHGETLHERRPVTAIEIDAWELRSVEVRREWRSIDVLLILTMMSGATWVVCIENKVNAVQRQDQLKDYREVVETEFPNAAHRLFVFLTKNNETPHDPAYISGSYHQIHAALSEAVTQRRLSVGNEPRVLIDNYIRILEENFMNDSDIARLAQTIYKKHYRAIEIIFAHRPQETIKEIIPLVGELLKAHAVDLGISMGPCNNIARFIPLEWDQPGNHHGDDKAWGWAGSDLQILFEIDYFKDIPRLLIVGGGPSCELVGCHPSQKLGKRFPAFEWRSQRRALSQILLRRT